MPVSTKRGKPHKPRPVAPTTLLKAEGLRVGPSSIVVLEAVRDLLAGYGYSPTRREIAERTGMSVSQVHYHIVSLVEAGALIQSGGPGASRQLSIDENTQVSIAGASLKDAGPLARLVMEQGGWRTLLGLLGSEDEWMRLSALKEVMLYAYGRPKGDMTGAHVGDNIYNVDQRSVTELRQAFTVDELRLLVAGGDKGIQPR